MKKVTWGIDQEVYDYLKEQAEKTGLSVQQTANLILKRYSLDIKIAPVDEKRKRGNPEFVKPKIFVIAGNVTEYQKYCNDNKVGPPVYVYLNSIDQLRGLKFIQTLHIGSYNKRPDYAAIKGYLMAFNGIVEQKGG